MKFEAMPTNSKFIDRTGQKFGRLTVLGYEGKIQNTASHFWKCICDCGKGNPDAIHAMIEYFFPRAILVRYEP